MKNTAAASFALLIALGALPATGRADAVSDQLKAYKAIGTKIDTHRPPLCNLITKSEAERYLGKPVKDGESAGAADGCTYRAADSSNDGILITRDDGKYWTYPSQEKYKKLSGIGRQAYVMYEAPIGYDAEGLAKNGDTGILVSGKYSADTAISLLKLAIKR